MSSMKICDYNQAKRLKALGYNGEFDMYVDNDFGYKRKGSYDIYDWYIPAPRIDDACYFLRDKYGISVEIASTVGKKYKVNVIILTNNICDIYYTNVCNNYESALLEGLNKALQIYDQIISD